MFKNIFSRTINRNLFNNLFAKEYNCYRNKLPQFSTHFNAKKSHRLITPLTYSTKNIKYPVIFYSGLAATVGHKLKFTEEKEENEKLQYAISKGLSLLQRDKFDKAEKHFNEALSLARELNNLDGILMIYISLAEIAVNKKQYQKGEQILIDAREFILQNGIPFDDDKVINIIINLGMTYELLNQNDKARENYEFAYGILEKKMTNPKEDELDTVFLWSSLLNCYGNFLMAQSQQAEDNEKAELLKTGLSHLSKALSVWVDRNGKESEAALLMHNELAFKYLTAGEIDTAIDYLKEAIEIGKQLPKSQVLPTAYNNLGMVYLSKGLYDESKAACEESLRVAKEHYNRSAQHDANVCLREIERHMRNAK